MFSPKIKYIALTTFILWCGIASAALFSFSGNVGSPHAFWIFSTNGYGNAGVVSFNGGTAAIEWVTLTGTFYLQTVGYATFDSNARIIAPVSGLTTDNWTTTGTATSPYAGTIYLDSGTISKTEYNPITKKLVGAGWNLGVGLVPFGVLGSTIVVWGVTTTDSTGVVGTSSEAFLGRVKVLWSLAWGKSYDTLNPLGPKINTSTMSEALNTIRKNISILSRNIPADLTNPTFWTSPKRLWNKIFFINSTLTPQTLNYSSIKFDFPTTSVDSLIIIGGDIIIDADILPSLQAKGIIVLKNDKWVGGNIIVTKAVKTIESSLFAEGTLYSGDSKTSLYNNTTEKVALLSQDITNQLYIHGSVLSRNTIGWAVQSGSPTCVYGEDNCTYEKAIQYDLNYFRGYDPSIPTHRAYRDATLDSYSLVIEIDPRTLSSPPPGLEMK